MDFGNTPATQLTERIMAEIREYLKEDASGQPTHYNRVYEAVHRHVIADALVANLQRKQETTISAEELDILRHSLGLDHLGYGIPFRNHFCPDPDSNLVQGCRRLVSIGLMQERHASANPLFHVTNAGRLLAMKA